ncbi:hypothetical protein J1P26_17435 [Neobacillus sp. MM2021_6]|uniref:hypothetical protein n=1 Tax=Bacillaceae TaxID=186817 RepID=UPI001A951621|nr:MULTISPECIES: hypothetical protein [Bacillaceae]MBO0961492.1 hypothetical protein [Neobacillus sp. MM2021_6]
MRFIIKDELLIKSNTVEDSLPISKIPTIPQPPLNPKFAYNPNLQQILSGKQLLLEDIPFTHEEVQTHYQNGYVTYRKGIVYNGKQPICGRCGNKDPRWFAAFPCSRCGETCLYCRHCLMMGRISECTPLMGWKGPVPDTLSPMKVLEWKGILSEGQRVASNHVVEAIHANQEHLIWAVCVAGYEYIIFLY